MPRGRKLFWTITGSVVAAVAVVIALTQVSRGTPPKAASPPVPHSSASANSRAARSAPVVIPRTSSTSPFTYVSDLIPASNLGELVYEGSVKIYGSIYPKSISFSCDNGDLAAFPAVYRLKHDARRFEATVGLEGDWSPSYVAGASVVGDGRTLLTFSVSVTKPETVDVNVTGVRFLTLECFSPGISSTTDAGSVEVAWGNARVTEGH
jgi:hypothetical protein